jgi:hypothetical protein
MRRALILAMLAGCSFTPNPTEHITGDGPPIADGSLGSDGMPPDGPNPDASVDSPPGVHCPSGYAGITSGGIPSASQYRLGSNTTSNWISAENDCENDPMGTDLPAHLSVLDSTLERDALAVLAGGDQWFGQTDLPAEGVFVYVTLQGVVLPTSPTGNQSFKDCVSYDSQFHARDCNETGHAYVCECDGLAASPARYPNPPNGN